MRQKHRFDEIAAKRFKQISDRAVANDGFCGTLSLSLHAATDEKRKKIMRVAERYSVKETINAMKKFFDKTRRRVVIE